MGNYITVNTEVEIDKSDIINELTDKDLLDELLDRDLSLSELDFNKEDLIDCICNKYSILDSDKIRNFFNGFI